MKNPKAFYMTICIMLISFIGLAYNSNCLAITQQNPEAVFNASDLIEAKYDVNSIKLESGNSDLLNEGPLSGPQKISPADKAKGIETTVKLSWHPVSEASNYRIQISTSADFTSNIVDKNDIIDNFLTVDNLEMQKNYFWRVLGYNSMISSNLSSCWSFVTSEQSSSQTLELSIGWNMVSTGNQLNDVQIANIFASLANNINIVKNSSGQFWIPGVINTIGKMLPEQGYLMNLKTSMNFTFPAMDALKSVAGCSDVAPSANYLKPAYKSTGNNASLIIYTKNISDGSEIGVWNSKGLLIGSGAINNGVAGITIWGDNEVTGVVDGATEDEPLTVKKYDIKTGVTSELMMTNLTEMISGNSSDVLVYLPDKVYMAYATNDVNEKFDLNITNTPNPVLTNTLIEYSIPSEGNVELDLYNFHGELITNIVKGNLQPGIYKLTYEPRNLNSGAYTLVLRHGSQKASQIMLIKK